MWQSALRKIKNKNKKKKEKTKSGKIVVCSTQIQRNDVDKSTYTKWVNEFGGTRRRGSKNE